MVVGEANGNHHNHRDDYSFINNWSYVWYSVEYLDHSWDRNCGNHYNIRSNVIRGFA